MNAPNQQAPAAAGSGSPQQYRPQAGDGIAAAARIGRANRASRWLLYAIGGVFVMLIAWAALTRVDDVTRADGRVIPSAKLQVVQNLEGGIVQAIHARQGDHVDVGAQLVSLSQAQVGSEYDSRRQQFYTLSARATRLAAETRGADPAFPQQLQHDAGDAVASERAEFEARRARQASDLLVLDAQFAQRSKELDDSKVSKETAERTLKLLLEERDIVSRMVERGLEPRLELVRLDGRISELTGKVESTVLAIQRLQSAVTEISAKRDAYLRTFRGDASAELGKTYGELRPLQKSLPAFADKVLRTDLRAPMKGIVNRVLVSTVGGVVKPGDPIVEIVPADDQLVVEARVRPADIGFVKIGQKARVKLTAYDYSIFGSMEGRVSQITADAVQNEKGESFFLARIETTTTALEALDRKLAIIPGMQAQIDIITGSKTVLTYLTKPLVGVKDNAFRER